MSEHETFAVTKYKLYTLVIKQKGKNDRIDEVEHAIFTGKGVLDMYQKGYARHFNLNAEEDMYVRESTTELEPVPANFSLPLNPVFKPEDHPKQEAENQE